jgi:hypothetical protein
VEEVCAVLVNLDARTRLSRAVRVPSDMRPSVDDQYLETEILGHALSDGESEESRADDDEVWVHAISSLAVEGEQQPTIPDVGCALAENRIAHVTVIDIP